MASGLAHRLAAIVTVAALCAGLLGPRAARAMPDAELNLLRNRMAELTEMLRSDPGAQLRPLADLLDEIGLPQPKLSELSPSRDKPQPLPERPAQDSLQTLRLALAILAQSHSGKDNKDVLLAQGPRGPETLTFRGGTVTMPMIRDALTRHALPPVTVDGTGASVLRVPVILWEDTVLRLDPQDRIALSRPDGAFILSMGRVEIEGSVLTVAGGENVHAPDFVPFVSVGGGGTLRMRGARVEGLGFGQSGKFSGVGVAGHPFMRPLGQSSITGSVFRDMMTVSVTGQPGAVVADNRFFDMRHNALLISGAPGAQVRGNLFFGDAVTNAIRVLDGSNDARIEGNYVLEGDRAAILVEGNSSRVQVTGNVLSHRVGGGIKFDRTRCGTAMGNIVLDMRQKGIEVRRSRDTTVRANLVAGSRNAGIWISAQASDAMTHIRDNVLLRNAAGITAATGGVMTLSGNDMSRQMPRLLDGDIALQSLALVRDLKGAQALRLDAGAVSPAQTRMPDDCAAPEVGR